MKAYFPSTVAFYEEMCVFCFLFFFKKRVRKVRETEKPEVPLWFGEGLRRSLVDAAGRREAVSCDRWAQSSAGLSFAWMFLFVEIQLGAIS